MRKYPHLRPHQDAAIKTESQCQTRIQCGGPQDVPQLPTVSCRFPEIFLTSCKIPNHTNFRGSRHATYMHFRFNLWPPNSRLTKHENKNLPLPQPRKSWPSPVATNRVELVVVMLTAWTKACGLIPHRKKIQVRQQTILDATIQP